MLSPSTTKILIDSDPKGAKVFQGARELGVTPLEHEFSKKVFDQITLTLKKEGFEEHKFNLQKNLNSKSLWNLGFITTSFGATSWGVDVATGALIEYAPDSYLITLKKAGKNAKNSVQQTTATAFILRQHDNLRKDLVRGDGDTLKVLYSMSSAKKQMSYEQFIEKLNEHKSALLNQNSQMDFYRGIQATKLL